MEKSRNKNKQLLISFEISMDFDKNQHKNQQRFHLFFLIQSLLS